MLGDGRARGRGEAGLRRRAGREDVSDEPLRGAGPRSSRAARSGIGAATAERLASEGAHVVVADFDHAAADGDRGARSAARAVRCDVTSRERGRGGGGGWRPRAGRLDILVTCAGIIRDNLVHKMTDDDWEAVIATHLRGTFLAAQAAQARDGGAEERRDGADLLDLGAREPRPGELLGRQGGHPGADEDARDRARPLRRSRVNCVAPGLHRDRDDRADGRRGSASRSRTSPRPSPRRRRCGGSGSRRTSRA